MNRVENNETDKIQLFEEDTKIWLLRFSSLTKFQNSRIVPTEKMKRSFFHSLRTYNNSKERLMAENSEAVYAVSARIFKFNTTTECGKDAFNNFAGFGKVSDIKKRNNFISITNIIMENLVKGVILLDEKETIQVDTKKGKEKEYIRFSNKDAFNTLLAQQAYMDFVEEIAEVEGVSFKDILMNYCRKSAVKEEFIKLIFFTNQFLKLIQEERAEDIKEETYSYLLKEPEDLIWIRYADKSVNLSEDERDFLLEKVNLLNQDFFNEKYMLLSDINSVSTISEKYPILENINRANTLKSKLIGLDEKSEKKVAKKV